MEYPTLPPFNASKVLLPGDKLPPGLDPNATAIGSVFYDNAAAVSPFSYPISLGQDGKGWVSIEEVFVRLNTTYAPNGTFARLSNDSVPDQYGNATYIGYDAAVCVELFEPWVLEVYNSTTGAPVSMRLVEQGGVVQSRPPAPGVEEQLSGPPLSITDTNVIRQLDSSNLANVYITAHQNSVNQLTKDNGRDSYYVPCPTLLSFTSGRGSLGYTELSPSMFAESRGLSDGSNLLPYFAGTGQMLARRYNDRVLSNAYARPIYAALYLAFIMILGLVVGLFVPKLPLGVPHRDFNMYTWMAAFQAEELVGESIKLPGISRNMALDNIAEQVGGLKFRYVDPQTRSGY
ncbi:hypothetical protein H0H81_007837 [Sphagnurus paluster]|uniref:Uncharacterized protein n=1 Tax=Sphagnurus paluster TaxID=117069 RepID=A0A9P7KLK6_9AGAR|nr:hypothetical protein H0H81_007837 [Sphagnurus paluster]